MAALVCFFLGLTTVYFSPEYFIWESKIWSGVAFCGVSALCTTIYRLFLYPEFFSPLKHIQTPSSRNWLTGNSNSFLIETPYALIKTWLKELPNEGLLRYYIVGNLEWVMPISSEALKEILVTKTYEFEKPEILKYGLRKTLGRGILLAEGNEHRMQRKNLLPAFSYRHVKNLYPLFWTKSVEMVRLIDKELVSGSVENNTVQIGDWAKRATLDIIGLAGMGCDFEALKKPDNVLHQSYKTLISQPLSEKLLFLMGVLTHPSYTMNFPTARNREIGECNAHIREAARAVIRSRIGRKQDTGRDIDIISVALESGMFDEENLIDQAMTFLGAGHDTTAASFQWAIYALCQYPGVQKRLREEIRTHLPSISFTEPNKISASTFENTHYLSAFCNEVLRFYPAIPKTVRKAVVDTTIVGKFIPKGTLIVLSPEITNHMTDLWGPDADIFDPERFLKSGKAHAGGAANNFANLSFLHGPRSCIAQGFAKAELACLVAAMVARFQMVLRYPDAELQTRENITIVPADGILAVLTPLDGW